MIPFADAKAWTLSLSLLVLSGGPVLAEFVDGEGFGIRMGTPAAALGGWSSASADPAIRVLSLEAVPKPHPRLVRYHATASEAAGTCSISGSTEVKPEGAEALLRALLEELTADLGAADEHRVSTRDRPHGLPPHAYGGPDVELRREVVLWRRRSDTRTVRLERDVWSTGPVVTMSFEFANRAGCAEDSR